MLVLFCHNFYGKSVQVICSFEPLEVEGNVASLTSPWVVDHSLILESDIIGVGVLLLERRTAAMKIDFLEEAETPKLLVVVKLGQ